MSSVIYRSNNKNICSMKCEGVFPSQGLSNPTNLAAANTKSEVYEEISRLRTIQDPMDFQFDDNFPILSLIFENNAIKASFFTMITTLGTPLDLTTQELRIESLFPADENTKELFHVSEN